jgi:hypothetical protein
MIRVADVQEQQKIADWVDGQTGIRITWQATGISELFTEFCRNEQHALNALRSLDRCSRSTVVSVELVPLQAAEAKTARTPARPARTPARLRVRQLTAAALRQA